MLEKEFTGKHPMFRATNYHKKFTVQEGPASQPQSSLLCWTP